jgi:23S rRNA (adenine2503-C2)-methyltransferase
MDHFVSKLFDRMLIASSLYGVHVEDTTLNKVSRVPHPSHFSPSVGTSHRAVWFPQSRCHSRLPGFKVYVASQDQLASEVDTLVPSTSILRGQTVIESPLDELSQLMGGSGKAEAIWKALREGDNPLKLPVVENRLCLNTVLSSYARERLRSLIVSESEDYMDLGIWHALDNAYEADNALPNHHQNHVDDLLLPTAIADETLASCGTRKYLSTLYDGNQIESVLIPSLKFNRTTLCVSTQIGCDRGCTFCATAKMGLVRNLTATEIISQVVHGRHIAKRDSMPDMTNIVFMGMGDAGRNLDAVGIAVHAMTDQKRLKFGANKVTVSTVGPSPEVFEAIVHLPCTIAWSLHAADDDLRKRLVPSTRHTTVQLRDGLIAALGSIKSRRRKTVMIAVTLIKGINDSDEDAKRLADFLRPVIETAPKLIVDLIPYNDIGMKGFVQPTHKEVCEFQQKLKRAGYFVSVRVTRGDDESAACGMLKTTRQKKSKGGVRPA